MLGARRKESQRVRSYVEKLREKLRFAVREPANFAPENEYEIDGEQKKFGLDGVAVFCDGLEVRTTPVRSSTRLNGSQGKLKAEKSGRSKHQVSKQATRSNKVMG